MYTLYRQRTFVGLLVAAVTLIAASNVRAQDMNIAAFFGNWQGNAISESDISVHFKLTSRDIGVTVKSSSDGFTLSWNTVQRQRGDPNNPKEELKATNIQFKSVRQGVWRGTDTRDPLTAGQPYAWAYIKKNRLLVNVLQIYPDGTHEIQVYTRTLTGGFMLLEFTRIVEGKQVRTAKGRLVKISN